MRLSARGLSLLLCLAVVGCGVENSSEYREVVVDEPAAPSGIEKTLAPQLPTTADTTPQPNLAAEPSPTEPKAMPVAEASTVEPTEPADELAISDARPFAVPLPEQLPTESSAASNASGTMPAEPKAGQVQLLIPEKSFTAEGPEKALRVTFDDIDLLKVLNMEPVTPDVQQHLPDWLVGLDGERIRLRGWMFPPSREDGISRFMFVRDNGICCFGRRPKVYDKVAVSLKDGHTTKYIQGRPFDVIGVMSVEADIEDGDVMWLYSLSDATVIDE